MLPFQHLNLRRNPFGELTPRDRVAVAVVELEAASAVLGRGDVVQLLAEHGRGKTTHLLALQALFPEAPYVRGARERDVRLPAAGVAFVDEADSLAHAARRALWIRRGALAVATHVDFTPEIRGAGRRVETFRLRGLAPDRLGRILERRIEASRRGPGPVPRVTDAALAALVRDHGDDVRAIERRLYDVFQDLREVGDVAL